MLLRPVLPGCGRPGPELGFHRAELPQHFADQAAMGAFIALLLTTVGYNHRYNLWFYTEPSTQMCFCAEGAIGCNYPEVIASSEGWQESRAPRRQGRG